LFKKIGVNEDKFVYELLSVNYDGRGERPYLKMRSLSINAVHIEGIKPGVTSVKEAICFRNGLKTFSLPNTLDGHPFGDGEYEQQGDALFFPNEKIPKDATLRKDNVAVQGLRRHLAIGKNVKVYDGFIGVPEKGSTIKHPEHSLNADTKLTFGPWKVNQVMEYDHLLEESRKVID
jgi:hypothetical protein